ncbi:MAG: hypothetical protein ACREBW_04385, partial [Candidatus Micrarchaeaceae archaeon]
MITHHNHSFAPIIAIILVIIGMAFSILGCHKQQVLVCPRLGMPIAELHLLIGRDGPNATLSNGVQDYSSVRVLGVLGALGVKVDSASQNVNSFTFYPDSGRSEAVQAQMLKVLIDTFGYPYSTTGYPNDSISRKRAWHAEGKFSYILETNKFFPRFFTGVLDTNRFRVWNYNNTGYLNELDLGALINRSFTVNSLKQYLKGRCLHAEETSGEGSTLLIFSPVFVCGIPGE